MTKKTKYARRQKDRRVDVTLLDSLDADVKLAHEVTRKVGSSLWHLKEHLSDHKDFTKLGPEYAKKVIGTIYIIESLLYRFAEIQDTYYHECEILVDLKSAEGVLEIYDRRLSATRA